MQESRRDAKTEFFSAENFQASVQLDGGVIYSVSSFFSVNFSGSQLVASSFARQASGFNSLTEARGVLAASVGPVDSFA